MTMPDTPPTAGDTPQELAAAEAARIENEASLVPPAELPKVGKEATEPTPAPEANTPSAPAEAAATVNVRVARPPWTDGFSPDGKLTIDRAGVEVPASDVANIVKAAASAGIELEVS